MAHFSGCGPCDPKMSLCHLYGPGDLRGTGTGLVMVTYWGKIHPKNCNRDVRLKESCTGNVICSWKNIMHVLCACVCVVCFSKEDGTLGHYIYGDINLLTVVSGGLDHRL